METLFYLTTVAGHFPLACPTYKTQLTEMHGCCLIANWNSTKCCAGGCHEESYEWRV